MTNDAVSALKGTDFIRLLRYLKVKKSEKNKLRTFDDDLKKLFDNKLNTILIKPSNKKKPITQQFMFGGGLTDFWKKKDTTVSNAKSVTIPEFKKSNVEPEFKPDLTRYDDIDFDEGVKTLFGDDPELVKFLIAYNKKYKDVYLEEPKDSIEVDNAFIDIVKDYPSFKQFFDKIDTNELPTILNTIQTIIRKPITKLLDNSNYDKSKISKQIKQQVMTLSSDIEIKNKDILDIKEDDNQSTEESKNGDVTISQPSVNANQVKEQKEVSFDQSQSSLNSDKITTNTSKAPVQSMADKVATIVGNVGFVAPSSGGSTNQNLPNLIQTHLYIQDILTDMDGFYKKMQRKQGRWANEINSMLNQGEVPLKVQIQSKSNLLASGKLLEIERRKVSIQLLYLMKKFIRAIEDKSNVNYATFKDYFFKDKRRDIRALLDYLQSFAYVKDDLFIAKFTDDEKTKQKAQQIRETYIKIESTFNGFINSFHSMNEIFYKALDEVLEENITDSSTIYMRDKERAQIVSMKKESLNNMQYLPKKIKYFYTLNYPVTEMFDMQFVIMYIIKFVRIISYGFSMNMATNIFIQKYESVVYDKKINPPSLTSFMFIFLGFDLFFNVFLLILLGLCGFLFKTENNTFPIDGYLYQKFAFDYLVSTIVIMLIGILVGSVIKQKKYFRYKTEGERGIRAFEDIMKMTATVITLIPLFMMIC